MVRFISFQALQWLRVWKYSLLSDVRSVDGRAKLLQPVMFSGRGRIFIGKDVVIGVKNSPYFLSGYSYIEARGEGATVNIGNRVWSNNNLVIICNDTAISIGDDTLIGYSVEILDSDFHEILPQSRRNGNSLSEPVQIERNVWIGSNVKVLKGVSIGRNSVIANGSVVSSSIPENVVAGGVPARIIKKIGDESSL